MCPQPREETQAEEQNSVEETSESADARSNDVASLEASREQPDRGEKDSGEAAASMADYSLMRKYLQSRMVHAEAEIEVQRANEDNPFHSAESFEELNLPKQLYQGIIDMGFARPSKIQSIALPTILADPPQNLIARSQSGTGKTVAFLLASLGRVDPTQAHPQVIILSPTYELAKQTGGVAMRMAKYMTDVRFEFAVRGKEVARGNQVTSHVIIGTPGKVADWALKSKVFDLHKIRVFVLDEADDMVNVGEHGNASLRIQKNLSADCQILFFSATYSPRVKEYADKIVKDPVYIRLKKKEESLDNINEYYIVCRDEESKYQSLFNMFGTLDIGQMFIFVETKKSSLSLYHRLTKDGFTVCLISGDLTVEERSEMFVKFRDGEHRVVITTSRLARGIDISGVSAVIHYDLPIHPETRDIDCETYLQQIGRTGRFGKAGLAFNMVDSEKTFRMIAKLEKRFGKPIAKLDASNTDEIEKINE